MGGGVQEHGQGPTPSHVQVEGSHEEVQVSEVGRLEELRLVHHGEGDPQGGPDVPRHHLVGELPTPALPLQAEGRQEVTGRLPEEEGGGHFRTGSKQYLELLEATIAVHILMGR